MESIPKALELIYLKKANLRRAFETLQAHSPSLSSFNLTWPDLDSHFASQISSLQRNLDLLQRQQKPPFKMSSSPVPGPARPELKSLCQKMKGLGLRNYITERPSEIIAIRDELQDALRCARDPAGLVLVALDGFHDDSECGRRWSCVVLLEALAALKPEIGGGLKEKAKKLAEEWKKKTSVSVENSLACLGFLYLVAAYELADGFDMAVLIDFFFVVFKDLEFKQAVQLCRLLSLNVPDLLSKLEMMSEKLLAVKFILEFKLTDKFPPVPILNEHVQFFKHLTERAKKRRKGTVGLRNDATKEINSLKSVIAIIEEYQLSEYPKEELVKHIESLEKAVEMQNSAETSTSKPRQQANTQDPDNNKHLKNPEPGDKIVSTKRDAHFASPPQQQSNPQELHQQANTQVQSKSKHLVNQEPGCKMVNSKSVIPPGSHPQQQSKPQEPSGSKCLESDQPGDSTVVLKRVTDESKQSASVPIPKPQQQSKPEEPIGSKHQKQSNLQEPPSGNGGVESEQPGGTNVGLKRVTDESQQSATDSASLCSFNVTWQDLESHFVSQTSSLQSNLDLLQCQQRPPFKLSSSPVPGPARPELKSLCEKMKGFGLRNYITERPSEIITIRDELQDALRCARDPAGLVLVALDGFHDNSECDRRWSCVVLLEALAALKPEIGGGLKEKAKKLAEEWKKKTSVSVENSLACLGFLYLVAAYELADGFDMAVLIDFSFVVVKYLEFKQAVQLCRLLSLNVPDLLSKLEMMSEKLLAVKFILEFKLTDKFPPVPILNEHVQFSKHLTERAKKRRIGTVGLRDAATIEINSLKSVIKIIDEYQLSEYPKEELVKHIESLEKAVEMQNSSETSTSKPRQQANTQDPDKNKHLKNPEPGDKIVSSKRDAHFASPPQQQSNPQELQQQANTQVQSKSKHLVNQEPGRKMVNSKSVIPPGSHPQQQSKAQEPSGSKCLESDQPGDSTVVLKRVTDESKQSASVPIPKPQQQSKPEEPIGSKHQKQSNLQEPPSGNGGVESEQPGDTKVGSKRVTDESQQSATDSASLSSFNVTWQVLESHFVSQTSSLQSKLELLQCQQKSPFIISSSPVPGPARPDLKSLCEKMKGLGLRNYIMERLSEIITIRDELQDALRCSRDPAGLVLVALEGFHDASPMGNENSECDRRWCYVVLLEALAALMPEIGGGLKEKVKKLAEEWQKKTNVGVESSLDCLGFLYLVAAYGLADSFDMDVLIDFSCVVVKDLEFEQAVQLCRFLSLNIHDLISKLETVNEKLMAVIIHEFKLTDKFPPVPIPNEHRLSKKRSRSQLIEMQTNAATEEVNSLKPEIKIESLEKAVEMQNSAETLQPQQQSNTQDPSESKQLENHEPCDKMVNTERVIPPAASSQPQEPSGSKSLGSGQHQPGDTTVGSKPEEAPSGSKRQKQSNPQEPPCGNGSVKSDQPGDTTIGSKPQLGGSKPPSAEQVGHKVRPTSNFSAIPQSNLQPAAPAPIGTVAHLQQPGQWPAAYPASFAGSPAGPYSWGGPYPNVNPNDGYVLPPHHQLGHGFGIPGNLRPPWPHVYPPEVHHPPAGYFPVPPHNGYGFPPNYHQR